MCGTPKEYALITLAGAIGLTEKLAQNCGLKLPACQKEFNDMAAKETVIYAISLAADRSFWEALSYSLDVFHSGCEQTSKDALALKAVIEEKIEELKIPCGAYDPLAEATGGKLHWNDPGMDEFEGGWKDFPLGTRVEVRTKDNVWLKGTVVETMNENDRGISVECDEKWHDNLSFYEGRGATVMTYMNTRRGILSNIRKIDEPRREIAIPKSEPIKLKGKTAELLKIAETAVRHSGGRLRLARNEEDDSEEYAGGAQRFLKLDGKRLGRDIEQYGFIGKVTGWEQTLAMFLEEVILPLSAMVPESYTKASEELLKLGETVYTGETLADWKELFKA
jgi:hypothetical protein